MFPFNPCDVAQATDLATDALSAFDEAVRALLAVGECNDSSAKQFAAGAVADTTDADGDVAGDVRLNGARYHDRGAATESCPDGLDEGEVWQMNEPCVLAKAQKKKLRKRERWCEQQLDYLRGCCLTRCRALVQEVSYTVLEQLEAHLALECSGGQPSRRRRRLAWCIWLGGQYHECHNCCA